MATKTNYTDEEVKQILHVLFLEKKKAKELEAQLQKHIDANAKQPDSDLMPKEKTEDVHKLRHLLERFQKRVHELKQSGQDQEAKLTEANSLLEEENKALIQQIENLKAAYAKRQFDLQALDHAQNELEATQMKLKATEEEFEKMAKGRLAVEELLENEIARSAHLEKKLHDAEKNWERPEFVEETVVRELSKLKENIQALENDNENLHSENTHLKESLENILEVQEKLIKFERELLQKETELNELSLALEKSQQDGFEYLGELRAEAIKKLELEIKLKEQGLELGKTSSDLRLLENEYKVLLQQYEGLKSRLNISQEELNKYRADFESTLDKLRRNEMNQADLEERLDKLLKQTHGESQLRDYLQELENTLSERQEQASRDKQRIEKLAGQLLEKDKRITELQHLEISLKRAAEQKQELEIELEAVQKEHQRLEEEKRLLENELSDARQHSIQLERVIQFLREKSEEAILENKQYQEEQQKLSDDITDLNVRLEEVERERKTAAADLENEQKAREENQKETQLLKEKLEHLEHQAALQQQEIETRQAKYDQLQEQLKASTTEAEEVARALREKEASFQSFEKEINLIKQTLVRGLKEAKEIEILYQEAIQEKAATAAKLMQAQHQIEKHRSQLNLLQEQLGGAFTTSESASKHIEQLEENLKMEIAKQEVLRNEINSKDLHIESLNAQLNDYRTEISKLESQIKGEIQKIHEKDNELIQAQQHFAKKVKETAVLEDQCEQQKKLIQEQHQSLNQNKIKLAELQTSVDLQVQQNKLLQEQLQEAIKSAEAQLSKWEQKYFDIYDKWQGAEGRIRELEKLEEKQKHLQGLLANLGTFIGNPVQPVQEPKPEPSKPISPQVQQPPAPQQKNEEPLPRNQEGSNQVQKPYQNLFNMPKPPGRPRQNFLE